MQPLLRVENLIKHYAAVRPASPKDKFAALDGVSLSIPARTTLALVGESGSGKSTLALCIARLEPPTSGNIWFEGIDVAALHENEQRLKRPQIQLVFQDPASSLNPRWTALEIVSEPFFVQRRYSKPDRAVRALRLLDRVAISRKMAARSACELSGGQKQRLAIARALAPASRPLRASANRLPYWCTPDALPHPQNAPCRLSPPRRLSAYFPLLGSD